MPDDPERTANESLEHLQAELNHFAEGLALLGAKRCSRCRRFFRSADPGALFHFEDLVCFGCIHEWWPQRCAEFSVEDREKAEGRLVYWLKEYHHAKVVKQPARLPESNAEEFQLVATCGECHGTGSLAGNERCRYCDGRGSLWVVVLKDQS